MVDNKHKTKQNKKKIKYVKQQLLVFPQVSVRYIQFLKLLKIIIKNHYVVLFCCLSSSQRQKSQTFLSETFLICIDQMKQHVAARLSLIWPKHIHQEH